MPWWIISGGAGIFPWGNSKYYVSASDEIALMGALGANAKISLLFSYNKILCPPPSLLCYARGKNYSAPDINSWLERKYSDFEISVKTRTVYFKKKLVLDIFRLLKHTKYWN